ncbi:MFS transporter [Poseidonocella sp. HB161398]|uniref:MFS transporter n=1 Tax=Poseidonocella sp. HB161398 TaxID=2320855 RepID=UPI0011098CEF|nr:MFS transporter [Poseidonocella sp. HB161398]
MPLAEVPDPMPPVLLPAAIFLFNALAFATFYSRLPEVAAGLGLAPGPLGRALMAQAAGTVAGFLAAPALVRRLGPRAAAGLCLGGGAGTLWAAASGLAGPGALPLAGLLGLYGALMAVLEVAKNLIAARIETAAGRPVLSVCHGAWSAGLLGGALLGGRAAAAGIPVAAGLAWLCAAILPLAALLLLRPGPAEAPRRKGAPRIARPDGFAFRLLLLVAGFAVTEGAFYDWSMFHLREDRGIAPEAAARIYAAFALGMIALRLAGDRLRQRWPVPVLLRAMAAAVLCGLVLVHLAPGEAGQAAGFALCGAGVALAAPVAAGLALCHPSRPAAETMAAFSVVSMLSLMAVPPLLGGIAGTAGAAWALAAAAPILAFAALFAPQITAAMTRGDAFPPAGQRSLP